jgi:5-methyltetrahydrofolate--homocysteine methyltransferase
VPRVIDSPDRFTVIGENIHATRVVLRGGRRAVELEDGTEAVPFTDAAGESRFLRVPDWYKKTQPYQQGHIKHFIIAMRKGIGDEPGEREEGGAYIQYEVRRQVAAGADYIDINPDEVHHDLETQKRAMRWAVETVQEVSPVPLSIDSSSSEIIAEGLAAYDGRAGRPIINSVAPERAETLDLMADHNARVIIMATSGTGMPESAQDRVENVKETMKQVISRGVAPQDVIIDAIIFPISVDSQNGNRYLDAVRMLRDTHGTDVHIGGGLSNVSFGMPKRRLINDTFIHLGLEAGIDSGIIDPLQSKLGAIFDLGLESEPARLAADMLEGRDEYCLNYIKAFRDGRLG